MVGVNISKDTLMNAFYEEFKQLPSDVMLSMKVQIVKLDSESYKDNYYKIHRVN